jgi:hypothetical protein
MIANVYKIKEHALKASELDPVDPTIWHLLGRWSFDVANIGITFRSSFSTNVLRSGWAQRKVASLLFAAPPGKNANGQLRKRSVR